MRRLAAFPEVCGLTLLSGLVWLCAFHPLYAVDFFWHLKLGEVIAETGAIPRTNLFGAAPERPYVQFNWLWELAAAEVVQHFGLHGVRVAQATLMVATFGGLYSLARALTKRPETALLISALGLVWFEDRFQERPAALVLAFVLALTPLLLGAHRRSGRAPFLVVALIALLWSNLHGGESLLLLLSLAAVCAGEWINRALGESDARPGHAALLLAVATASLLLSPTFVPGMISWLGTIGEQIRSGNEEWQHAYSMLAHGLRPAFVIIALGPTVVASAWCIEQWWRYRREGRGALDACEIFLCVGYLALAHQAVRNVFLALVPLFFMLQRAPRAATAWTRGAIAAGALALLAIVAEDALLYSYGSPRAFAEIMQLDVAPDAVPDLVAEFVRDAQLEGGVVNDGRWGGYLIWQLWPRCNVFADSRHHFTDDMWQIFRLTHDALQRPAGLERAFRSYGTELAIFKGPTFPIGAPPHYRLLYKAGDQEVYQDQRGSNASENLERTRDWLARQGVAVPSAADAPEIPELARQLGAVRFFATPEVRRRLAAARDSGDHATIAALRYRAGDYREAAVHFERALERSPTDLVLQYQAAQNAFAGGDYGRAAPRLRALLQTGRGLSPRQLRRVQAMLAQLSH